MLKWVGTAHGAHTQAPEEGRAQRPSTPGPPGSPEPLLVRVSGHQPGSPRSQAADPGHLTPLTGASGHSDPGLWVAFFLPASFWVEEGSVCRNCFPSCALRPSGCDGLREVSVGSCLARARGHTLPPPAGTG